MHIGIATPESARRPRPELLYKVGRRLTCVSLPVHLPVLARPLGPLFALEEPLTRQIVIEYKSFSIQHQGGRHESNRTGSPDYGRQGARP